MRFRGVYHVEPIVSRLCSLDNTRSVFEMVKLTRAEMAER